jgi:hypothetical protein
MTMADFHTCNATFTSPGSIRDEWVWYQNTDQLEDLESSLLTELPEGKAKQKMQLTRLDKLSLDDFEKPSIVFYCDNRSVPCVTSLYKLVELLNGCANLPNIFVLNALDFVKCSNEEKQLLKELFPFGLYSLGETSWFNELTLVASSALSTKCMVAEIATSLKKIGIETDSNQEIANQKMKEAAFWKFVQSALPTAHTYKLESHVASFKKALMALPEELFHQYRYQLDQFSSQLDSWDFTDAASCIEWCSDDSYTDFSTSIILRDRFYEFLSKPEETLLEIENPKSLFKEGLNYVFYEVQDEKKYSDIIEYRGISNKFSRMPAGVQSSETLKGLKQKYPRLYEKFRARKKSTK